MAATIAELMETLPYGPAPEAAGPAHDWLAAHDGRFGLLIGGVWTATDDARLFESFNPATARPLARITQATGADVDTAVDAATTAFASWSALPGHARARHLYALGRAVQRHSRLFAVIESLDNGKPIRETRDIDIPLVARHFYHHAGWAQLLDSEFPGYTPLGVAGQIIPWNFPLLMLSWKIAPALAAGNTVVLKPAEWTSLTALLFGEICIEAGLPPGVVNIVTGDGKVGEAIVTHPGVAKIAFTGSTEVGRRIRTLTAGTGKGLSLELGGKSPFIVFADADLDSAVEGVVDAIWFNQGQVCCAGSRLLVQEGIADAMIAKLRARMERLRVGDPLDKAVDIGAIVAPRQLERITQLVQQSADEGAQVWQPSWSCPQEGWFYPPTLLTDVAPASTAAQIEIFGPVLALMTFRTPDEAVALANNTRYGLAASVWSENISLALDVARRVLAGVIWINGTNMFDAAAGFGGYRESGFGREGGREGLVEYLRAPQPPTALPVATHDAPAAHSNGQIDRTYKVFVGGKQARPDSGYSRVVLNDDGDVIGTAAEGNRKDIRNAVEAARTAAASWSAGTGHGRAQVVYYLAENLSARADLFVQLLQETGASAVSARAEVDHTIAALFTWAAWADKYDGALHHTSARTLTLAVPEALGVLGIIAPDAAPLAALVTLVAAAIAQGNSVVAVPGERGALLAFEFALLCESSDLPAGVVSIVSGPRAALTKTLAEHNDVDGLWYAAEDDGAAAAERASAGNLKRTWVIAPRGWHTVGNAPEFLRRATQWKNIWAPYGA